MQKQQGFVLLGLLVLPIVVHTAVAVGAGVLLLAGPLVGLP